MRQRCLLVLPLALLTTSCLTASIYADADVSGSVLLIEDVNLPAGAGEAHLSLCARRSGGTPIAGLPVALSASGCTVTPPLVATDANGWVTAAVACASVGQHLLGARLVLEDYSADLGLASQVNAYMPATGRGSEVVVGAALDAQVSGPLGADGLPVAGYRGTAHFSCSDPQASLPPDYTFTGSERGTRVFPGALVFHSTGLPTVTARDVATGALLDSHTYTIASGTETLRVSASAAQAQVGTPVSFVVTALDGAGNTDPNFSGVVTLSSSDARAVLAAPYTFGPADGGQKTFAVRFPTAGLQRITATWLMSAATSPEVQVDPGLPVALSVGAQPRYTAGTAGSVTVRAEDAYGNVATGYDGTVALTSSDPQVAAAALVFDAAAQGSVDTPYTPFTAGLTYLTASSADGSLQDLAIVSVTPAGPSSLGITGLAGLVHGLRGYGIRVAALDAYGNATGYLGRVHFSSSDASAILPPDSALGAQQGFTVQFASQGQQTVTVEDPGGSGLQGSAATTVYILQHMGSSGYSYRTCATLNNNVKCWGLNQNGRLGLGDIINRGVAAGQMGPSLPFLDLGVDSGHVDSAAGGPTGGCSVTSAGSLKCWGESGNGQLGLGDTITRGWGPGQMGASLPSVNLGTGRTATQVTLGNLFACALLDTGAVKCWGDNTYGQLGVGDTRQRGSAPGQMGDSLPPVGLLAGHRAVQVSAGQEFACARLDNGGVQCWGNNAYAQLGLGDTNSRGNTAGSMGANLPMVSLGSGRTAVALSAGTDHACAVLDSGAVKCWGRNLAGELGLGDTQARGGAAGTMGNALPSVDLGSGRTALQVCGAENVSCALLDSGQVKCWGRNGSDYNNVGLGQLGLGDTTNRGDSAANPMGDALPAIDMGTGRSVVSLMCGQINQCAVLDNNAVKCWGENGYGQLGVGDGLNRGLMPGQMGDALPELRLF